MLTNAQEQERNVVACDLFLWSLKFFQIEEQQNRENDKTFLEFLRIAKIQLLQLKRKERIGQTRIVKGSRIHWIRQNNNDTNLRRYAIGWEHNLWEKA